MVQLVFRRPVSISFPVTGGTGVVGHTPRGAFAVDESDWGVGAALVDVSPVACVGSVREGPNGFQEQAALTQMADRISSKVAVRAFMDVLEREKRGV